MANKTLWYGYLNAGKKSSAVINDPTLNTGSNKTLYLYNHSRNAILEYQRAIVESKLRDLNEGEVDTGEMVKAYTKIRAEFVPKGGRLARMPDKPAAPAKAEAPMENDTDLSGDDFMDDLDDDLDDEDDD